MMDRRVITVLGVGEKSASPHRCHVWLALNVTAPSVAEAMSHVADLAERVTATLRAHGLTDADLQTVHLSVQDFFDQEKRAVTARIGSYVLMIKARIIEVGALLAAVGEVAGDRLQVQNIQLAVSDPEPQQAEARRLAVGDALARATQLADAAGLRLGVLLAMNEDPLAHRIPGPMRAFAASASGPGPQVVLEGGEVGVTVQVTATYAIEE